MGISRGIGWSIPGGPMGIGANGGGGIGATGVITGGAGMGGPTGGGGEIVGGIGAAIGSGGAGAMTGGPTGSGVFSTGAISCC